jgi:Dullard-like phosphatase family protein
VLDLDDTLVHTKIGVDHSAWKQIEVELNGNTFVASLFLRPFLGEFLRAVRPLFKEVVLFTAAREAYAENILSLIDPGREIFGRMFSRSACRYVNGEYKKDLRVVKNDLSSLILVDNSPSVMMQPENGYSVVSFYTNEFDCCLRTLINDLYFIISFDDVREGIVCQKEMTQSKFFSASINSLSFQSSSYFSSFFPHAHFHHYQKYSNPPSPFSLVSFPLSVNTPLYNIGEQNKPNLETEHNWKEQNSDKNNQCTFFPSFYSSFSLLSQYICNNVNKNITLTHQNNILARMNLPPSVL